MIIKTFSKENIVFTVLELWEGNLEEVQFSFHCPILLSLNVYKVWNSWPRFHINKHWDKLGRCNSFHFAQWDKEGIKVLLITWFLLYHRHNMTTTYEFVYLPAPLWGVKKIEKFANKSLLNEEV